MRELRTMNKLHIGFVTLLVASAFAGCLGVDDYQVYDDPNAIAPECPNGEPCVCIDVDESCSDGDDDWGYDDGTRIVYYCSGDSPDYAEAMGGEYCPNENNPKNPTPVCPDGEYCVCIDVDGSCEDGDDDFGYYDDAGNEVFFCSNDGPDYAWMMGGIHCSEADSEIIDPCEGVIATVLEENVSDIRGFDLTCANLADFNFSGYDLTNTSFVNANLVNVNFTNATLNFANFSGANLSGAIFTDVSIRDTICPSGSEMLYTDDLDGICI